MSAACRTGREMKVEVCVRSCHLGSDCKCSSKTAYRVGNQQPLPWHSTHRWPHFAVGADTYLSILGVAFLWLNFFPAPIPSLLQCDLYLESTLNIQTNTYCKFKFSPLCPSLKAPIRLLKKCQNALQKCSQSEAHTEQKGSAGEK